MRPMSFARLPLAKSAAAAAGFVFVLAMLAAPAPARAGDDDDVPLDTKILRGILEGIGLQPDGKQTIDYHERPPLVIPGDKTLPPPETTDAVIANNPAWPKDPDVARRKEYQKQARKGVSSEEIDAWSRPLSPAQMMPGGDRGATGPRRKISEPNGAEGQRLTPSQLGYRGGLFNFFDSKPEGTAQFTGEPARTSLTEPPPGYQTPSPAQPYGEAKSDTAPKAMNATEERIKAVER
jgi:hypothetical protein